VAHNFIQCIPQKRNNEERKSKGMLIKRAKPRGGIEKGPSHPYMVGLPSPPKSIEKEK
jgi:hypothetical protein